MPCVGSPVTARADATLIRVRARLPDDRAPHLHRQQLDAGALNPAAACAPLATLRDAGAPLSDRGSELLAALAARGEGGAAAFAAESRGRALGRQSCITCMESVHVTTDEVGR